MKQKGELCMYKLIIIEDHKMLRDMIAETLNSQDDFEVKMILKLLQRVVMRRTL